MKGLFSCRFFAARPGESVVWFVTAEGTFVGAFRVMETGGFRAFDVPDTTDRLPGLEMRYFSVGEGAYNRGAVLEIWRGAFIYAVSPPATDEADGGGRVAAGAFAKGGLLSRGEGLGEGERFGGGGDRWGKERSHFLEFASGLGELKFAIVVFVGERERHGVVKFTHFDIEGKDGREGGSKILARFEETEVGVPAFVPGTVGAVLAREFAEAKVVSGSLGPKVVGQVFFAAMFLLECFDI
jgi:hypothetical protein